LLYVVSVSIRHERAEAVLTFFGAPRPWSQSVVRSLSAKVAFRMATR
jgi:hypothetical protein